MSDEYHDNGIHGSLVNSSAIDIMLCRPLPTKTVTSQGLMTNTTAKYGLVQQSLNGGDLKDALDFASVVDSSSSVRALGRVPQMVESPGGSPERSQMEQ